MLHRGRILLEQYGHGATAETRLESWSMGKSLSGTLMGTQILRGDYGLWDRAPIEQWQARADQDPRAQIRIGDLMRMSSGLRVQAPYDPDDDQRPPPAYYGHWYLYTAEDAVRYAATRPLEWLPNTVGRYRNTDPVLINALLRRACQLRGEDHLAYPRRALFDRIGMRSMVLDTDSHGNFLTQGYESGCARDWARLGLLYLRDGVWTDGQRLLPAGFVEYASTVAPAWIADGRPIYGGAFFWVNGDGAIPIPRTAFSALGAGGQYTVIIPSHELVVVRLGHYSGEDAAERTFYQALHHLVRAVPGKTL